MTFSNVPTSHLGLMLHVTASRFPSVALILTPIAFDAVNDPRDPPTIRDLLA